MASTDLSSRADETRPAARRFPVWLVWFGLLLLISYGPVLRRLVQQWIDDPDMGHGLFVPVIAGYIIWLKRGQLAAIPVAGSWWGAVLVAWGMLQLLIATLGVELFLARTAFLITLVGALLMLRGVRTVAALAFPLFLLVFMVPIPAIVFTRITFPLQLLASRVAEVALGVLDIPVLRDGNILELPSQRLSVVEACSGIRSLLSLSFLSLIYAYFFDRKVWMRGVLLAAAVPIAITANAARVTLTGIISEYKREWAEGFFHLAEGWVIFLVAMLIMVAAHQFINNVHRIVVNRD